MGYYIYDILREYKNQQGRDLWNSLYTADGLKSDWRKTFKNWLNELADMAEIPKGHFRDCWIRDIFFDAHPNEDVGILYDINQMFEPDEEEEEETEDEILEPEWETVYSVQDLMVKMDGDEDSTEETQVTYYQTYGGGPEGGYFVEDCIEDCSITIVAVYEVHRDWYKPWTIKELKNTRFAYEPEDNSPPTFRGKEARCRVIKNN